MTRRFPRPPPLSCAPRSFLDFPACRVIDTSLKEFKTCSRQLQTIASSYMDELHVLERLYYKGKNQHRLALFWRRVEETRRYGNRLRALDLPNIVDLLRCSFFGDAFVQNPKVLKGSWTHYPNAEYIIFVMNRLYDCCHLLDVTRERLNAAYRLFVISMQSGYFVQLMVTLAAIVSRVNMLNGELRQTLEDLHRVCYEILRALHPEKTSEGKSMVGKLDALVEKGAIAIHGPKGVPNADIVDEDIGISVAHKTVFLAESSKIENLGTPVSNSVLRPSMICTDSSVALAAQTGSDSLITANLMQPPDLLDNGPLAQPPALHASSFSGPDTSLTTAVKRKTTESKAKPKHKTKKRKKDEIDEIFGF